MRALIARHHAAEWPAKALVRGHLQAHHDTAERATQLLLGLQDAGLTCRAAAAQDHLPEVSRLHTPAYLAYLQTAWAEWRKLPGAAPEVRPNIWPTRHAASPSAMSPVALAGRYVADGASPIVHDTWANVWAGAEAALAAADQLLDGQRAAYALCRPSGHHALSDMAMGGCFLANTALAAERLTRTFGKVAVLDIDMHHGNGTQQLFYARDDVLTVSIHGDPTHFYPFFSGYAEERGEGPGEGLNLNLPLAPGTEMPAYAQALETALRKVSDFDAAALVVATGFDTYFADAFGIFALQTADYGLLGRRLAAANLPTLFVQEGGYFVPALRANVRAFVDGFLTA